MASKILVPMDDSEMAREALEYALEHFPDAEFTILHVVGGPSPMWGEATGLALADDLEEATAELSEEVFAGARETAEEYDTEIETKSKLGHPGRAIINEAEEYDTVVVGSHGGTLAERLFVGNVAEQVFNRSPVTVVVVR